MTCQIDGLKYECTAGHALFIPGNAEHGFWNTSFDTELVFLCGFACDGYSDVIYRFTGQEDHGSRIMERDGRNGWMRVVGIVCKSLINDLSEHINLARCDHCRILS